MPLDFPSTPTIGDQYTGGNRTWEWNGTSWIQVVATANISDNAVTSAKIATGAVGSTEIATDAILSTHVSDSAITTDHLASNAVTSAKIADGAITSAKIADGTITNADIASNANINISKLSGNGIAQMLVNADSGLPQYRTITGDWSMSSLGVATISNGAVTQAKIASGLSAVTVCTSSNKPASPFDGQVIYMTDADQHAVYDGSTWVGIPSTSGSRNLLVNGDFKIWQRGNARTYMLAGSYLADRWCTILFQNAGHERVTGRTTQYAMRVSSSSVAENSNGTRMWLVQKVESLNSYRLRNQQVTLSFWVRFSSATCSSSTATPFGNWTAGIGYYTSTTDSATGTTADDTATNFVLTNGSLPTTWTKYSVTGTCPSNLNNIHATFGFSGLGNTASNSGVWYEVAEVQLEVGAVATPFEFEDHGTTLAKCQRFYQRISNWSGIVDNASSIGANAQFIVRMRTGATVTKINGSTLSYRTPAADNSSTTWGFSAPQASDSWVWFQISSLSGLNTGQAIHNRGFGNDILEATAEL